MTDQEIKRSKELSATISALGKTKTPLKSLSSYIPTPEKEFVFETAESIAKKLNSLPSSIEPHVVKGIPTMDDIVSHIKGLKGNDRIDISNIRNGEQISALAQRNVNGGYNMNDLRWHGSGGASSSTAVNNEVVSGSGTTFTLVNLPSTGSQKVFAIGQRLTPTVDYTISGKIITTVSSWNAGDILADYII